MTSEEHGKRKGLAYEFCENIYVDVLKACGQFDPRWWFHTPIAVNDADCPELNDQREHGRKMCWRVVGIPSCSLLYDKCPIQTLLYQPTIQPGVQPCYSRPGSWTPPDRYGPHPVAPQPLLLYSFASQLQLYLFPPRQQLTNQPPRDPPIHPTRRRIFQWPQNSSVYYAEMSLITS